MTLASFIAFPSILSFLFLISPLTTLLHGIKARTEHLTSLVFGHYGKSFLLGPSGDQKNCIGGGTTSLLDEKPDHHERQTAVLISDLFSLHSDFLC